MLRLVIWPSMVLLGWTETKLWTLKHGSKSIQTSLILTKRPPKPYKFYFFFIISLVTTVKSRHVPTIWKKLRWKSLCLPSLESITEIIKILTVYMVLGDAVLKLENQNWILNHVSRSITWSLFTLKSTILGQMTNLNMIFHVVVSVYRLVKTWNSPQFPAEFRKGQ